MCRFAQGESRCAYVVSAARIALCVVSKGHPADIIYPSPVLYIIYIYYTYIYIYIIYSKREKEREGERETDRETETETETL